jgi:MFS family permease
VGAALLMPASLALLLAASPPAARPQAVAMWGGISALAVATGPSLGSLLIDAGGWRWAFIVNLPVALVAGLAARRSLRESVVGGPFPDLLGIALVSLAVAALALGITQGDAWGWSSGRVLSTFAVAAVLGPIAVARSARHPAPAIDLRVFESRTVRLANAATLAYAIGFFAMLLSNVLFLTTVWHYSTLRAGLAITPGPLVVAALSSTTGKLAARIGYRPVLVAGGLTFAAGELLYISVVTPQAHYLSQWLPASLLVGVGVALTFPVLSAAAVSGLPADKFGIGGAINQTARQLGAVLGVALLVALLGTPSSAADAMNRFRHVWLLAAGAAFVSAAISMGHARRVNVVVPEPALAADGVAA